MTGLGPQRAVILVGFMGAGKTSAGRSVAEQLGWQFEDLDARIEKREGSTIPEIFRDRGEGEFRRLEYVALCELLEEENEAGRVIAVGGGAYTCPASFRLIEESATTTIFLDAPVEELWGRCTHQAKSGGRERPLLASRQEFQKLYEERRPHYLQARMRQETSGKTVEEIAEAVIDALRLGR